MVRHFLGILFSTLIGFVLFVNLFQFSGAPLPIEGSWGTYPPMENSFFGFSSILNFFHDIGDNDHIKNGLDIINNGFSMVKLFTIDEVVRVFKNTYDLSTEQPGGLVILSLLANLVMLLAEGIIAPFAVAVGLLTMLVGIIMFLWELIAIVFTLMLGQYNTPFFTSYEIEINSSNISNALQSLKSIMLFY